MGLLDKNRLHLLGKRLSIRIEKQWSTFAEKVVSQIPKESYLSATKVFLRFLENGEASWEEQVQALKTIEKLLAINSLKDISDVQIEAQIEQLIAPIIIQLYFSSTEVISQRYCALIVEACEAISKKERYIYELFSEEYQKYIIGNTCYRQTFANKAATIYAILDFPFGADVICENTKSTFYYLSDSLKETLSEIEKTSYSDTQVLALSDKVVDCNNLIKTILSLLSHHEQFFRAMFSTLNQEIVDEKQNNDVFAYENTLSSCITMCTTSEYTKEFGQLAAMAVASLLDLIGSPENVASLIFQLFSGKSGDKKPLKNVNINVCFDILSSTSYTNFSELAIYRGFLANLRTQTLVAAVNLTEFPHPYGYCLHSIMFQKLIGFCDASSESQIRAFAFETLNMWFETVRLVYKDATKYPVAVLQYLQELLTDDMYQYILSYVWNNWDDPIDLVQHRVKDLFDIVLKISENRKMLQGSGCTHKQFLGDLVKRLIEMDWYRKVKYALLSSLIPQVGTSLFLQVCPDLISKALLVFHNQVLSPRSSHLIVTFIEQGKKEILQSNSKDYKDWIKIWLAPVCRALSSESDLVRKNVSHYLLDRVIKVQPDSFWLAIESLQTMDDAYVSCSQYRMNAMISIIKAGKSLDLIDGNTFHSGSSNVNEKKLSVEILREVIYHGDLYLRIDVLALLCQAQKVTAEVTRHELDLLKDFLTLNMNHTSPEFRQKLYGHFTKLFIRLRGNLYSTWREYQSKQKLIQKRGENVALQEELKCLMEKIVNIKLFLTWLCDLSMASLYPGSSFQRVSSALKLFELLIKYFGSDNTSTSNGPVRENCDSQSSPFYLPLATERNSKILIETLMNPFEANRETVRRILFSFPSPLPGIETTEDVQKLLWWGFEAMTSNRADQSNCGATVFRLLFSKYVEKLEFSLEVERNQLFENRDLTGIPSIDFATKLLNLLENQLNSASQNLLFAAQNYPMHGTLMALMFIFQDIDYHSVDIRNSINLWRQLHLRTFDLANLVCSTVLNILSDPSPEGNNPLFQEIEEMIEDATPQNNESSIGSENRAILSYCWRAVKEASTLLGVLLSRAPLNDGNSDTLPVMSYEHVIQGGNLLRTLLTSIRHRGAFSAVYPGYIAVCSRLLTAPDSDHSAVPKTWLNENLDNILSNSVSVTRRSAGIPLCILAIVSSEPADSTYLLNYTMKKAFKIAREVPSIEANQNTDLPQVHAFNILRQMFTDAKQGTKVLSYVEDGLMLAISGFSSDCWAIRNCSVMLFSTLLQRTLGTKKTKDEHHSMNTMTGKEFFSRFPKLHPFLLTELELAVEQMLRSKELDSPVVHPGLYPVLTLLSRLQPSVMDGPDSALTMSAFVPAVLECASGCIYKTREMAARALVPLVVTNDLVTTIEMLWSDINIQSQNKLHGRLVQLLSLLRGHLYDVVNYEVQKDVINCIAVHFQSKLRLLLGDNKCGITRAVFYDMMSEFVFEPAWITCNIIDQSKNRLTVVADDAFSELRKDVLLYAFRDVFAEQINDNNVDVGRYLVLRHASKIITQQAASQELDFVKLGADEIIEALLEDPDYEVRLSTLRTLHRLVEKRTSQTESKFSMNRLWLKLAQLIYAGETNLECFKIEISLLSRGNFIPVVIQAYNEKDITFSISEFWNHLMNMMSSTRSLTVVEFTLPLIGSLVNYMWLHKNEYGLDGKEILESSKVWSEYVMKYSEESMSESLREVALASIQRFEQSLKSRGTSNTCKAENEILVDVYRVLIRLLQDDDIDIRQESAQLISKIGELETPLNSERAAEICCQNAAKLEPTSLKLMRTYLDTLNGGGSFETIIKHELNPNQALFAAERPNIYKEDLIDTQLIFQVLRDTLAKLVEQQIVDDSLRNLFLLEGYQAITKLNQLIESSEKTKEQSRNFGPFGFTGHATVFLEAFRIASIIILAKKVSPEERFISELKSTLAKLEHCNLHPLLRDFYFALTGSVSSEIADFSRDFEEFFSSDCKNLFLTSLP